MRKTSKNLAKQLNKSNLKQQFNLANSFVKKDQLTLTPLVYYIHDNGGKPFKIMASNKGINVYTYEHGDNDSPVVYNKLLKRFTKFLGFWVGYDTSPNKFHGNTILIQETKLTVVSITWDIKRFKTTEEISAYVSPVGNSDVPYPIAFTKNNVYFINDNEYVPKADFITTPTFLNAKKLYSEYYGHLYKDNKKNLTRYHFNSQTLVERI